MFVVVIFSFLFSDMLSFISFKLLMSFIQYLFLSMIFNFIFSFLLSSHLLTMIPRFVFSSEYRSFFFSISWIILTLVEIVGFPKGWRWWGRNHGHFLARYFSWSFRRSKLFNYFLLSIRFLLNNFWLLFFQFSRLIKLLDMIIRLLWLSFDIYWFWLMSPWSRGRRWGRRATTVTTSRWWALPSFVFTSLFSSVICPFFVFWRCPVVRGSIISFLPIFILILPILYSFSFVIFLPSSSIFYLFSGFICSGVIPLWFCMMLVVIIFVPIVSLMMRDGPWSGSLLPFLMFIWFMFSFSGSRGRRTTAAIPSVMIAICFMQGGHHFYIYFTVCI